MRQDLVLDELFRRLAHLPLFVGEILGGKDLGAGNFGYQVFAAFCYIFRHVRNSQIGSGFL